MSIVSHSPATHLGFISNLLFSTLRLLLGPLNLLWAEQAQFLQPLLTGHTLRPSGHLGEPQLDSLEFVYTLLILRIPKLLTFLQKEREKELFLYLEHTFWVP